VHETIDGETTEVEQEKKEEAKTNWNGKNRAGMKDVSMNINMNQDIQDRHHDCVCREGGVHDKDRKRMQALPCQL
jgi:hypothetical protein